MKFRQSLFASLLLASGAIANAQSTDLALANSIDKISPLYGTNVKLSLTVTNYGEDNATGVSVSDLLPAGYQFVSATPEAGTYNAVTGVWTVGAMTLGQEYKLDIIAKVLATGSYLSTASVTGNETDPEPANNTATVTPTPTGNLYWDGGTADIDPLATPPNGISAGGAGTWDNTLKNWDVASGEADYLAWNNTPGYTANLSGTAGTVTLGSNISAGKLAINGAYTIATGTNTLTLTGTGTTIAGNNTINISGTGAITLGSPQTWDNTTNIMTVSAPVNTGANLLTLSTRSNNLDVTGKISGTGGLTVNSTYTTAIAPSNGGTPANPTLNNSNDYTGTTTINGNIWLNSGDLGALGADTSDIILNGGGFRLTGIGAISRNLQLTGNCGISKVSGTTTVNGVISGTGNFTASANFSTGAAVVLANSNTFTGNCLSGPDGVARLAHVNALASATIRFVDNNGRSVFDLSTNNLAYNIGGLGNSTVSNISNNLNLGTGLGTGGNGLVSFGANNQSNTYVGILSGSAGFNKTGTGVQTLIGDNTYTGKTVVAAGTLKLGKITGQTGVSTTTGATGTNVNRLGGLTSTANLYIGQAVNGALIPTGARIINITTISGVPAVTLDLGPTSPSTATTVNFPDMLGSIAASPIIEVQSGATFDVSTFPWTLEATQTLTGTGTVNGAITAAGIIAPGSSTGTLTTGNVTLTGTYACEIDGASCDTLAAATLNVSAGNLVITAITAPTTSSYIIATYTGSQPAPFATVSGVPGYHLDYTEVGKIKLVQDAGGGTPFENWAAGPPYNLTGPDALPGADPDNDGVKNVAEFALGGNPKDGSKNGSSLVKVQDVSGSPALTLTFLTRIGTTFDTGSGPRTATKDGVTYSVQGGQNLSSWTATITEVPVVTPGAPSGYEYHTFRTAGPVSSTARDFIRVQVVGQ